MLFLLRLCLAVVLAAGLSSAVAVPVALNSRRSVSSTNSRGDTSTHQASVNVNMCSGTIPTESHNNSVDFGAQDLSAVCGNIESSIQISSDQENINKALQGSGGSSSFANLELTGMTDYCDHTSRDSSGDGGDNQGLLTLGKGDKTVCQGIEYLRLGNSSNTFLKKSKGSSNSVWKLGLCTDNCGDGAGFQSGSSTAQTSVKENRDSGKELKFYKGVGS